MKFVPNAVSTRVARSALIASKHSPQTLFVAGIVGMGATVVLACKATLQVENKLEEHDKHILQVDTADKKAVARVKGELILELGKLYAPAIICGSLSISALAGSHNILSKRNAGLVAAYGTLQKTFDEYRGRVRESLGDDREREIYHDALPCEINDEATGKKIKVKRSNGGSIYARFFDEHNRNWNSRQEEMNPFFIRSQEKFANQRLIAQGHLFLNEVYDSLGFERTKEGAVVGWVKGNGDDYIDFGVFDQDSEMVVDFCKGENGIWLDFNVDGVIYDLI